MKLEVSLDGEIGYTGMAQIQSQLANMSLHIEDIKKGKYILEYVWFIICRNEVCHKDLCPSFLDYLYHVPIPNYHAELKFSLRTFIVHQNIGHGHEPLLDISSTVTLPPVFHWSVRWYTRKYMRGYKTMDRKRDENQWAQTVLQTRTKSTVQNPPVKINDAERLSCGIESYENCNITSRNSNPT